MRWRRILTAEEMRAAEAKAIGAGVSVGTLMDRAGTGAAEAIRRFAGPLPALVLCGPGNNGGDGYVIARALRAHGVKVRVAALGEPQSQAARAAREAWGGDVEPLESVSSAPLLIDSLFGTGLKRGLDGAVASALSRLAAEARVRVAVDMPSGVSTDDGAILSPVPDYALTVTFAALKPCHLLQPAARHMGRIVVGDIGVEAEARLHEIGRPTLSPPAPDDHKYKRGYVAIIAGEMPGAASLTGAAAARAGAGYVRLVAETAVAGIPHAIVQNPGSPADPVVDSRIGAIAVGPGLGRTGRAGGVLESLLGALQPLVLDADALHLMGHLGPERIRQLAQPAILTPHAGEFARMFGTPPGSKVDQARSAAERARAVVVYKGADTVVAAPDGRAAIGPSASPWLATAGTGDVLTGIIAAMRARGLDAFEAASAGVWLHGRAAALAGAGLIADDLIGKLPTALAECGE
jgi:ADP-dependent NAD(P)H-hydrate dehydratase / NAD(P)H-hydrate epimerase